MHTVLSLRPHLRDLFVAHSLFPWIKLLEGKIEKVFRIKTGFIINKLF